MKQTSSLDGEWIRDRVMERKHPERMSLVEITKEIMKNSNAFSGLEYNPLPDAQLAGSVIEQRNQKLYDELERRDKKYRK